MRLAEVLVCSVVVGFAAVGGWVLLRPSPGIWVVAHGSTCWVVRGGLYQDLQTGSVQWTDPQTSRPIVVNGARTTEAVDGRIDLAMRALDVRDCIDPQRPPAQ